MMPEKTYILCKNKSGPGISIAGQYRVMYSTKEEVEKDEDPLTFPISIAFCYGDQYHSATERLILMDGKIFSEGYKGQKLGNKMPDERNHIGSALKLRENLEELLSSGRLPKQIVQEISQIVKKNPVKV